MQIRNAENANTEARMHLIALLLQYLQLTALIKHINKANTLLVCLCNNVNMLCTIKMHLCNVFVLEHIDEK